MVAALGALNMSTRSWMFRAPPSRMLRAIDRSSVLEETAPQVAVARLQADAADRRSLERGGVELLVDVSAAAAARIADDPDPRGVVVRARQVRVAAAVLIAEGDRVGAARARRTRRPRTASR